MSIVDLMVVLLGIKYVAIPIFKLLLFDEDILCPKCDFGIMKCTSWYHAKGTGYAEYKCFDCGFKHGWQL